MIEPHSAQLGASSWTRKAAGPAAPRFIVTAFTALYTIYRRDFLAQTGAPIDSTTAPSI